MTRSRNELAAIWPPNARAALEAGHKKTSPTKAIREKCLDCCVGQPGEIRLCESVKCALWPFRNGQHPYTLPKMKIHAREMDFSEKGSAEAATSPSHGANSNPRKK